MAHGDDRGLRLPPLVAPQQVVIVPIYRETEQAEVLQAAAAIRDDLKAAGVRVRLDDRAEYRPGFKFNEWELKGAPVRIELGGRDLTAGAVTVARRDTGEKQQIPFGRVGTEIQKLLSDIQTSLFRAALQDQERRTLSNPDSYPEMIEYLREARGFAVAPWCGSAECEARIKDESSATIRCLPLVEEPERSNTCICCGRPAARPAVWAQAY
jgi:prolyl-tRNA synthetase